MEKIRVNWVGPQVGDDSLSIVNRYICRYLQLEPEIVLRKKLPKFDVANKHNMTYNEDDQLGSYDITIIHQWPPNWSAPKSGRMVCMQPWEYGAIPSEWYIPMKDLVDEIWVYSEYNKECYIRCGIPAEKIHVIPLGVDKFIFHNNAKAMNLELPNFRFLFVGGTIARKGIDLLIEAYMNEFTAEEKVCLFIKDIGTQSFYKGITLDEMILQVSSDPKSPRIEYTNKSFSKTQLAGLYKACDCLVHPYRGEGFGLPIVEAMGCGIPVIVPDKGPSMDFCNEETAFFVPSKEAPLLEKRIGNLETIDYPWWLSIEKKDLQKMMRFVYENHKLAQEKGRKASEKILTSFTWENTAQLIKSRIKNLVC